MTRASKDLGRRRLISRGEVGLRRLACASCHEHDSGLCRAVQPHDEAPPAPGRWRVGPRVQGSTSSTPHVMDDPNVPPRSDQPSTTGRARPKLPARSRLCPHRRSAARCSAAFAPYRSTVRPARPCPCSRHATTRIRACTPDAHPARRARRASARIHGIGRTDLHPAPGTWKTFASSLTGTSRHNPRRATSASYLAVDARKIVTKDGRDPIAFLMGNV